MKKALSGTVSGTILGAMMMVATGAQAQTAPAPATGQAAANEAGEIIVTAQKRVERLSDVGMSIQALSATALANAGVADPKDLVKLVPGFTNSPTAYGNNVYTIRGIGFQETTLAASPTVTVYVDEVPIPFSLETSGTGLDLQRVEVLKGPQGTLYGQNSTGGLINFISAQPTNQLSAGGQIGYGTYNAFDAQGYVSGPISDTLKARVSFKVSEGGAWQKNYTTGAKLGAQDMLNGRLVLDWDPSSKFHASLTVSGWRDHGETLAPQFFGLKTLTPLQAAFMPAGLINFPVAPHNDRAADWDPNVDYHKRNDFIFTALKLKYALSDDISLTSLTSYQHYKRYQPVDGDGTSYQDYSTIQAGKAETWYQELRLAGSFGGKGNWMLGGNYEHDQVFDQFQITDADGSQSHVVLSASPLYVLDLPGNFEQTTQEITTSAVFGNVEYPLTSSLKVQGGVRYTENIHDYFGQAYDGGNGNTAYLFTLLQTELRAAYGLAPSGQVLGVNDCFSLGAAPTFLMGCRTDRLKESNVSWKVGLDWKVSKDTLLYANVSQGYKAGGFPTIIASTQAEMNPVTQERVLAYEAGVKSSLFNHTLDLTAAAFYYDYHNKQTIGRNPDILFGTLLGLFNVPKSRVTGFEVAAAWRPLPGVTLTPMVAYTDAKVLGHFINYDYLGNAQDFGGHNFPLVPKVQGSVDAQYQWAIGHDLKASVGGNLSFQGTTYSGFIPNAMERVPSYALLDLRAGIEHGNWRLSVWGRNVTNKWYWNVATLVNDAFIRQGGTPRTMGVTLGYTF